MRVWLKRSFLALIIFLAASQLVQLNRTNPPIDPKREINASLAVDPAVAGMLDRACDDCHSNRTAWPWYSKVAPASWLVVYDVNKGRRKLNFSEWATYSPQENQKHLENICKQVSSGDMPEFQYLPFHPRARLTEKDVQAICSWTKVALPLTTITKPIGQGDR